MSTPIESCRFSHGNADAPLAGPLHYRIAHTAGTAYSPTIPARAPFRRVVPKISFPFNS